MKTFATIVAFAGISLVLVGVFLALYMGADVRYIVFVHPWWFLASVVPLAMVGLQIWRMPRPATLKYSRTRLAKHLKPGIAARLAHLPDGLRVAVVILLAVVLARPQSSRTSDRIEHEGIDIAIVLDLSESMQNFDIQPNRLEAAKAVIDDFIRLRPYDRIALVAFGATASTIAPLTMDHDVLRELVRKLNLGVVDGSSTAVGAGLGVALNRLKESEAESQVIVLLTDGVQTAGGIDPDTAAKEAIDRGIHIYTVLIGRNDSGQSVDPGRLERIASSTGGFAYTAEDSNALVTSFQDLLDKLRKSTIEGEQVRAELFHVILWPALILLLLDVLLRTTRLRRFP